MKVYVLRKAAVKYGVKRLRSRHGFQIFNNVEDVTWVLQNAILNIVFKDYEFEFHLELSLSQFELSLSLSEGSIRVKT